MAIVDLLQCDPELFQNNNVFAWKFPSLELATWAELNVRALQEAYLISDGIIDGPFAEGIHALSTKNIPNISQKLNLNGHAPFSAAVWFIKKNAVVEMKWGTIAPVVLPDPIHKVLIPVGAYGQFTIQITDSKVFISKLTNTISVLGYDHLRNFLCEILLTQLKESVSSIMNKNQVSLLDITPSLIAPEVQSHLIDSFKEYGLTLLSFNVNSIKASENDPTVSQLKAALSNSTNERKSIVKTIPPETVNSSNLHTNNSRVCPNCAAVVSRSSNFCPSCGLQMPIEIQTNYRCSNCDHPIFGKAQFCSNCGKQQLIDCPKCKNLLPQTAKFCSFCGVHISI